MKFAIFLCLILSCSINGKDHWKEHLRKRIVRDLTAGGSSTSSLFWRRTTASSTTKPPVSIVQDEAIKSSSSSSSFTTFQNQALVQTNKDRAAHCAPNLILNATLNSIAQQYANELAISGTLTHSNNGYGENLYSFTSSQPIDINSVDGAEPIDYWYKEVSNYDWSSPGFSSSTGHFTQLVWIATTQFGIGIACSNNQKACYVVANYSPPGNDGNQKQYQINVKEGPPCT